MTSPAPIPPESAAMDDLVLEIRRGSDSLLVESELRQKLSSGRPLRVKAGFDPTSPDLHLGHAVLLTKLRALQDLGHHVLFLVGDFTAAIGDPTGKNAARPPVSAEQIALNAKTYAEQAFRVLDPERAEVRFNSEWLGPLGAEGLLRLASEHTLARLLERDDFARRHAERRPIALHEILYPILQGHDSVALGADLEVGGSDQTFNLLMGREAQRRRGMPEQCVLAMPLLEGTDGVEKMSKSLGNAIGILEAPESMFGKIMSLSDTLMWRYIDLLSPRPASAIAADRQRAAEGANPRDIKAAFASEIVERFHSRQASDRAREDFEARFRHGALPESIPEISVSAPDGSLPVANALREAGLASTTSEALRLIAQKGVRADGALVSDKSLAFRPGDTVLLQIGKRRFARVRIVA